MIIQTDESQAAITIELTPIIDMVFLLLVFFLVATTFHQTEREMRIALPAASSAGPISAILQELIVNIDADGQIIVAGKTMTAKALRDLVQGAIKVNPNQRVTVRGDRATAYANIVVVLDICKGAGIQEPYLDTVLTD